jgi:hypothetical protein
VAGTVLTPVLLPWLPGRAFSAKGAIAGAVLAALAVAAFGGAVPLAAGLGLVAAAAAYASYCAMMFTGSSTFTSPSGVEWEMRRAIPAQAAAALLGVAGVVVGALGGLA